MRNVVTVYNPVLGKYAPKISFVYLDQFCLQSKLSTSEIIKAEYDKAKFLLVCNFFYRGLYAFLTSQTLSSPTAKPVLQYCLPAPPKKQEDDVI